jgi:hypothetical protein
VLGTVASCSLRWSEAACDRGVEPFVYELGHGRGRPAEVWPHFARLQAKPASLGFKILSPLSARREMSVECCSTVPSADSPGDRCVPGCDGVRADEVEVFGRCRSPDSPCPVSGCGAHVQVPIGRLTTSVAWRYFLDGPILVRYSSGTLVQVSGWQVVVVGVVKR